MQDPVLTPIFLLGVNAAFGLPAAAAGSVAITAGGITFSTGAVASVLSAATLLAVSVGVSYYMQPEAPKPAQGTIPLRQSIPPRIVGFGEVRVAGNYVLYEQAAGNSHDVLGLCQGPLGGVKQIYLDDNRIGINPSGQVFYTGHFPAYVNCFINMRFGNKVSQSYSIPGLETVWTANHRGDGVASLYLSSINAPKADFIKYYPHGLPKPSAAVFLPCWDFRAPEQNPDNPETWCNYPQWDAGTTYAAGQRVRHGGIFTVDLTGVIGGMLYVALAPSSGVAPGNAFYWGAVWSNPVLQAVTYLTNKNFGMGLPRERLITPALAALTAEAAVCDAYEFRADGNPEPRYASNLWFKMETDPEQVLGQILSACDGWVSIDGDGALALKVGRFEPPTVTLDARMIISVNLNYGVADEDKIDELTLSFTSPAHDYTSQAVDSWRDEEAILTRGKVRTTAFGPSSVQSASQVRRLAKRIFLRANAIRGSVTTHLGGMIAAGQRYVIIRYPLIPELDGAAVEIRRRDTDLAARQCRFEFVLVDPELLEGWVPEEEGEPIIPPPVVPPEGLPVPQNVTALPDEDEPPVKLDVSWDDPERAELDYVVRYRQTDVTPGTPGPWIEETFTNATIAGGRVAVAIFPTNINRGYEIQVATLAPGGTRSNWSDSVFVFSDAPPPSLDYSQPANSNKWLWLNTF